VGKKIFPLCDCAQSVLAGEFLLTPLAKIKATALFFINYKLWQAEVQVDYP